MDVFTLTLIILFVMAGSNYFSWKIGQNAGIVHTLDYLEEEGMIEFDDED